MGGALHQALPRSACLRDTLSPHGPMSTWPTFPHIPYLDPCTIPLRLQSQICYPTQPPRQSCGQQPHPPAQRALWSITLLSFSGCLAVERTWCTCLLTEGLSVPVWSICTRRTGTWFESTLHNTAPDVPQTVDVLFSL